MRGDHSLAITTEYFEYVQFISLISREYRCAAEFLSGTFIRRYVTRRIKLSNSIRNVEEYRSPRKANDPNYPTFEFDETRYAQSFLRHWLFATDIRIHDLVYLHTYVHTYVPGGDWLRLAKRVGSLKACEHATVKCTRAQRNVTENRGRIDHGKS